MPEKILPRRIGWDFEHRFFFFLLGTIIRALLIELSEARGKGAGGIELYNGYTNIM